MKKLFVLISALFLIGSVTFAQTEKTGKTEKKTQTESINKDVKPTNQDVKPVLPNHDAKPENKLKKDAGRPVKIDQGKAKPETGKPINPKAGRPVKQEVQGKEVEVETTTEVSDDPNGAEITFKETNHDFGTIPFKGNGSYEFEFVNTGNEPLILTQPKSSCGCTVPEWPRKPILPGESEVVKVTYKNTDRPGSFNKYVTVFSNAKVNKEVKLHIKGTVEAQPTDASPLKDEGGTPVKNN